MTDDEYAAWLDASISGDADPLTGLAEGRICRQGLYNWEDPFDACWVCDTRPRYSDGQAMECIDGYRHSPMYDATEDEIDDAWRAAWRTRSFLNVRYDSGSY